MKLHIDRLGAISVRAPVADVPPAPPLTRTPSKYQQFLELTAALDPAVGQQVRQNAAEEARLSAQADEEAQLSVTRLASLRAENADLRRALASCNAAADALAATVDAMALRSEQQEAEARDVREVQHNVSAQLIAAEATMTEMRETHDAELRFALEEQARCDATLVRASQLLDSERAAARSAKDVADRRYDALAVELECALLERDAVRRLMSAERDAAAAAAASAADERDAAADAAVAAAAALAEAETREQTERSAARADRAASARAAAAATAAAAAADPRVAALERELTHAHELLAARATDATRVAEQHARSAADAAAARASLHARERAAEARLIDAAQLRSAAAAALACASRLGAANAELGAQNASLRHTLRSVASEPWTAQTLAASTFADDAERLGPPLVVDASPLVALRELCHRAGAVPSARTAAESTPRAVVPLSIGGSPERLRFAATRSSLAPPVATTTKSRVSSLTLVAPPESRAITLEIAIADQAGQAPAAQDQEETDGGNTTKDGEQALGGTAAVAAVAASTAAATAAAVAADAAAYDVTVGSSLSNSAATAAAEGFAAAGAAKISLKKDKPGKVMKNKVKMKKKKKKKKSKAIRGKRFEKILRSKKNVKLGVSIDIDATFALPRIITLRDGALLQCSEGIAAEVGDLIELLGDESLVGLELSEVHAIFISAERPTTLTLIRNAMLGGKVAKKKEKQKQKRGWAKREGGGARE